MSSRTAFRILYVLAAIIFLIWLADVSYSIAGMHILPGNGRVW